MSYWFADSLREGSGRSSVPILLASCQQNSMDIYHYCVYREKILMMDRGTVRNMWIFHSKNRFENLVHVVGFIIRIVTDVL